MIRTECGVNRIGNYITMFRHDLKCSIMFGLMVSYLSFDYIGYGHESGF